MAFKERITINKLPILEYALKNLLTDDEYNFVDSMMNYVVIPDDFISATSLCLFAILLRVGMVDEINIQELTSLKKIIPPSIDAFERINNINSLRFNDYAKIYNKFPPTEDEKKEYIKKYQQENQLLSVDEINTIRKWNYDEFTPTKEECYLIFKAVYFTLNQHGFIQDSIELLKTVEHSSTSRVWRNNLSKCIKTCIDKISIAYNKEDAIIQEIRILNERMCLY